MKAYFKCLLSLLIFVQSSILLAQPLSSAHSFTRADTLRGMLTPLRSCYDINYYHLDVKLDVKAQYISGSNLFKFTATQDFRKLQFDLFSNLNIEKVVYKGSSLPFTREYNAVFVEFPETIRKGVKDEFTVYYAGNPTIAANAPWDGGFVFSHDSSGAPWVAVACQGFGASSWWPTKDHQSDEVDSMLISITVPEDLTDISNGRLRSVINKGDGYKQYNWFVSYPINNYCVTLNVAKYAHFSDEYQGEKGNLTLDFYVLRENLEKARRQFAANVKPMLKCFEHWFGPYPFYRDGYKLIETPYLGMEHQSAVAYGNKYMNGYLGKDLSGTGLGNDWDYIIVHESGHEWFGNNITSKDIADMWIHEAFTMYSEGLFVECAKNKEEGARYIAGVRANIQNDIPIIGPYNVNKEGSGDMYYKGANMLQTLRTLIDDDRVWLKILRGLNATFGLKTTTTQEIVDYFNKQTGKDLSRIFDQYLRYTSIPKLQIRSSGNSCLYRWVADVKGFDMPVRVRTADNGPWKFIYPSSKWQKLSGKITDIDTLHFYIATDIQKPMQRSTH